MKEGRTIEIYIPTGDPLEVKVANITISNLEIVFFSRQMLNTSIVADYIERVGVYVLVGMDNDGSDLVYIGEAENVLDRLGHHKRNEEFWNGVYVITNEKRFDKAHVQYLEKLIIKEAREASRFKVTNDRPGKSTSLTNSKKSDCDNHYESIRVLFKSLNFNLLESNNRKSKAPEKLRFYFKSKDKLYSAEGEYINEVFYVLAGIKVRRNPTNNKKNSSELKFQDRLLSEGVIARIKEDFVFMQDYQFSSPSRAANVVALGSYNGRKVWKTCEGESFESIFPKDDKINV